MSTFSADVGFSASSKSKPFAWSLQDQVHMWCTCDPHFGMHETLLQTKKGYLWDLGWAGGYSSPQHMNPRCHKRTCQVIHFAQTAKIFICTWKNLTKNSSRSGIVSDPILRSLVLHVIIYQALRGCPFSMLAVSVARYLVIWTKEKLLANW